MRMRRFDAHSRLAVHTIASRGLPVFIAFLTFSVTELERH
jgi:hypothetical protein